MHVQASSPPSRPRGLPGGYLSSWQSEGLGNLAIQLLDVGKALNSTSGTAMGQLGVEHEAGPQGRGRGRQAHLGPSCPTSTQGPWLPNAQPTTTWLSFLIFHQRWRLFPPPQSQRHERWGEGARPGDLQGGKVGLGTGQWSQAICPPPLALHRPNDIVGSNSLHSQLCPSTLTLIHSTSS